MIVIGRKEFKTAFETGQIIASGGPRSRLQVHAVSDDWFSVVPIFGKHKTPIRMYLSQLSAVVDGFSEIDPKRIAPTIQSVLVNRGEKKEHTTENYLYGFARAYLERQIGREFLAEEIPDTEEFFEGAKKRIVINAYEREPAAREACIRRYGSKCAVCSFDFRAVYGELGASFIHVHHLTPIAKIGREYSLDPVRDLRPICPNCHAMLHRKTEVLTLAELRTLMELTKAATQP